MASWKLVSGWVNSGKLHETIINDGNFSKHQTVFGWNWTFGFGVVEVDGTYWHHVWAHLLSWRSSWHDEPMICKSQAYPCCASLVFRLIPKKNQKEPNSKTISRIMAPSCNRMVLYNFWNSIISNWFPMFQLFQRPCFPISNGFPGKKTFAPPNPQTPEFFFFWGGREVPSSKNQKSRDFVGDLLIPAFILGFLPDLQVGQTWRNHRGWLEMGDGMRKKVPWGRRAM